MFRLPMNKRKANETITALAMLSKETLHKVVIDRRVYVVDESRRRQLLRPLPRSKESNFGERMFGKVTNRVR